MRIAYDVRLVEGKFMTGTIRYAVTLISHLLQVDARNEYLLIGNEHWLREYINLSAFPNATVIPRPQARFPLQNFLWFHHTIERLNVDIFHAPHHMLAPFKGKHYRKIVTVHDLTPFVVFSDYHEKYIKTKLWRRWFYKTPYFIAWMVRSADMVIASSAHTKQNIIRFLKVPAEKIHVVWIGIDRGFTPGVQIPETFFEKYQLPRQFLLYFGQGVPHKGLHYLIQAYAQLPIDLRTRYKLELAGKMKYGYLDVLQNLAQELGVQEQVVFPGYIVDTDLCALYSAATLLVHPSLSEGFGLTPVEAMACGTPVVYADTSSVTEVVGDAGLSVLSASAEALAQGIQTLLYDESLRRAYAAKGIQQAQRYSWDTTAREVLDIYRLTV